MDPATKKLIYEAIKSEATDQVKSQLKQYFNTLNHRIQRLESAGYTNVPAYIGVQKTGGRFTVGGKSLAELSKEFARAQAFEKTKTSTVASAKTYLEKQAVQFANTIRAQMGDNVAYNNFQTIVNMLKERKDVQHAVMKLEAFGKKKYEIVEQNVWQQIINETESETEREAAYMLSNMTSEDLEAAVERYATNLVESVEEEVDEVQEEVQESLEGFTAVFTGF